jgi:hypothetical protein
MKTPCISSAAADGKALLPRASFQKSCIDFKDEGEMPLKIAGG